MALPLAAMAIGAQAGGSILKGFFEANQKKNEAAVAKYNAAVMRNQADSIRMRTKFQQERTAEESARIEGELRVSIGGAGIVSTQGAPLLALALQKTESDLQNYLIGYEGRLETAQAENRALEFDMQRKFARIGARQAMIGSFLGAGVSAMQGWANMKSTTNNLGRDIGGGGTAKYNATQAAAAGG